MQEKQRYVIRNRDGDRVLGGDRWKDVNGIQAGIYRVRW